MDEHRAGAVCRRAVIATATLAQGCGRRGKSNSTSTVAPMQLTVEILSDDEEEAQQQEEEAVEEALKEMKESMVPSTGDCAHCSVTVLWN